MESIKKFDFDNSFDVSEEGVSAARDYTLEDIEETRRQSYEEGKNAGLSEANASIERALSDTMTNIGNLLPSLVGELKTIRETTEQDAVTLITTIIRKLVPHYAQTHAFGEIEGLVRQCLASVYDEPRVVIRVNDSILDRLKEKIDTLSAQSGYGGKIILFADQSLDPTDCRIEWADGGTERDIQRLWEDVETTISHFIENKPETSTGTPAQEADTVSATS